MRTFWTFASAGQLSFGRDAIKEIGRMVHDRGWGRALIVTDKNIVEAGIVDCAAKPLREAEIEVAVFDGGEAEPTVDAALNANDCAAEFKPDVIHFQHAVRLGANLILTAKNRGIPVVVTLADYWFLCPQTQMVLPDMTLCWGPESGTKCLQCPNASEHLYAINRDLPRPFPLVLGTSSSI